MSIYMQKIKASYQSINEILTIKEYWFLIGQVDQAESEVSATRKGTLFGW